MASPTASRESIVSALDQFRGAVAEYPFVPEARVYKVMGKMFALVAEGEVPGKVTLKAAPADGAALESMFQAVRPGYHMNKKHWITVELDSDVSVDLVLDWAQASYALVVAGLRKADRDRLAIVPEPE